ncbi:MAG: DUF2513 domain-containing protein [Acidobacteriota bacterium]|nr:MAG: DUF2513 domain-containing protein [Acidobacteriota bacterium]
MKRDLDLIRQILLDIETEGEDSSRRPGFANIADDGYDPESIQYHVQLMHDAGLIVADELVPGQWWPERITWVGHEFLDLARSDTLWQATKRDVESKVGSAPFQVVRDLLARRANDRLSPDPRTRKK